MGVFFQLDEVDAFTTAAIGQPGSRVFYLQVRQGEIRITVKCEKQQASAIAEYLRKVMNDLPSPNVKPLPTTFDATVTDTLLTVALFPGCPPFL